MIINKKDTPGHLMKNGKEEDPSHGLFGFAHGAPNSRSVRMTHVDVPLHSESKRKPRVKYINDQR